MGSSLCLLRCGVRGKKNTGSLPHDFVLVPFTSALISVLQRTDRYRHRYPIGVYILLVLFLSRTWDLMASIVLEGSKESCALPTAS